MNKLINNNSFYIDEGLQEDILLNVKSKTANSIILAGPKGSGKLPFLLKLSKYLLCKFENNEEKSDDPISLNNIKKNKSYYLFDNNTHPDFFYLTKNIEKDNKNIPIDKVREFKTFFYKTFSISKVKIALINSIEDLSINSSNLILKTLEELPENSYVFIVCNDPINISETIKSRCALFYVNRMIQENFIEVINKLYPQISEQEKFFIINNSMGLQGLASELINENVYQLYELILNDLITSNGFLNLNEDILQVINSKDQENLLNFLNIIINDLLKKSLFFLNEKKYLELTLEKEKELIQVIIQKKNYAELLNLYSEFNKNMSIANSINLNKSDILIDCFKDLCGI